MEASCLILQNIFVIFCLYLLMKLKLEINGNESPDDFKLLKTTISTVASMRRLAVLRFDSDRLVTISTPKVGGISNTSGGTLNLRGDNGQLWCTIPRDVFNVYEVSAERQNNTIALECNCESLRNAIMRYDKVMTQGSASMLSIKLRQMPEWNAASNDKDAPQSSRIRVAALAVTFEELVNIYTDFKDGAFNNDQAGSATTNRTNKLISHSFKVPVRFLNAQQDERIQEPMMDYNQTMLCRLPSITDETGGAFLNFLKRIERYSNVNHIKLHGSTSKSISNDNRDTKLKIVVDELDWNLEICWNGPLEVQQTISDTFDESVTNTQQQQEQREQRRASVSPAPAGLRAGEHDFERIEDSELDAHHERFSLESYDTMDNIPQDHHSTLQEVIIRSKDLKVCSKLFSAFEQVIMAISHDYACVFHCSLDRSLTSDSQEQRENGQIIYYIARSRGLQNP